jgi:hypothetical protein
MGRGMEACMRNRLANPLGLAGDDREDWHLRWLEALNPKSVSAQVVGTPGQIEAKRRGGADQRLQPAVASDDDVLWVADGRGGYRAVGGGNRQTWSDIEGAPRPDSLPANPATPEGAEFVNVANPENKRLKQEHIKKYGYWPKTADGLRDYVVSHIKAIADGGTNTLDNIEPMDSDEHLAKHKRDGDFKRIAKRPGIARAFGGRVEPPLHASRPGRGLRVRGLGPLGLGLDILDLLSRGVRTDSFDNYLSDMLGYPSQEDIRRQNEEIRRRNYPNSKPGSIIV